ncbi:MAG: formylmethanofuran dehydrogenase subunit E family protein [Ferruginibacter sp.]|jgi:formylmethanofuran dehydrogenase subunit E|nr:formylmethanofuran dehydrogenase subunit E family protein [Ferruginibacter sp.]
MKLKVFLILIIFTNGTFSQNSSVKVIDTDFSKGRLQNVQTITLDDAVKLHGHLCDGLVVGFLGLKETMYKLYTDSIIDRTNNRIVSKPSPCLTDIAIFMTGARYQYNTFYVSDSIKYQFIVQRIDNEKTYGVKLKSGLMPSAIDSLGKLAVKGDLDACGIDSLRKLESQFSSFLLSKNPQDLFIIEEIKNYKWVPVLKSNFLKTDVLNMKLKDCN